MNNTEYLNIIETAYTNDSNPKRLIFAVFENNVYSILESIDITNKTSTELSRFQTPYNGEFVNELLYPALQAAVANKGIGKANVKENDTDPNLGDYTLIFDDESMLVVQNVAKQNAYMIAKKAIEFKNEQESLENGLGKTQKLVLPGQAVEEPSSLKNAAYVNVFALAGLTGVFAILFTLLSILIYT